MRTTLESGAWIEHRPIQDLKTKDKDAVDRSVKMVMQVNEQGELDLSRGVTMGGDMQLRARNAALARIVTDWSYDMPVPFYEAGEVHDEASIDEIPLDDFNEIEQLIAPYLAKLRRRPDPKGSTTSSSNGSSRASAGPASRKG